jgi:hypothetical protein
MNYLLAAPKPPKAQERQIPNPLPFALMNVQRFDSLANSLMPATPGVVGVLSVAGVNAVSVTATIGENGGM